ncbi:MAG: general secretion pathway protein GspK [Candidatus Omnitrophica bacterium]|nr:general secretion pathway protein GspK [Candidatus Omnitrophota bacterium]
MAIVWIIALLGIFVGSLGVRAQMALSLGDRYEQDLQARYLAKAGVQYGMEALAQDVTLAYDGSNESWYNNPGLFLERRLDTGTFKVETSAGPNSPKIPGLLDEDRKININTAPEDVLQNLFVFAADLSIQDATTVAQSILDWRDEDSEERDYGAEGSFYRNSRQAHECKDGPLENVEELLLVRGVEAAAYRAVLPYVTVYGSGHVNFNTAGTEVLTSLGFSEAGLATLNGFRVGEDGIPGNADDRLFVSAGSIVSDLEALIPVDDLQILSKLVEDKFIGVNSRAFRMQVEAWTPDERGRARIECVFDRGGKIYFWSEH